MSAAHEHPPEDRSPDAVPPDVRGVARLLDERGARLAPGRGLREALSAEAIERIFAASDLQLPVANGSADGAVIHRIGDRRRPKPGVLRGSPFLIAASLAAIIGLGVAAYVATDLIARGASTPSGRSVVAMADAADAADAADVAPAIDPTYFDFVLASMSAASEPTPSGEAVTTDAGLDGPRVVIAGFVMPADHESSGGTLLDGVSTTHDDLTGELAALGALAPVAR